MMVPLIWRAHRADFVAATKPARLCATWRTFDANTLHVADTHNDSDTTTLMLMHSGGWVWVKRKVL
jgi:hypothetical protein